MRTYVEHEGGRIAISLGSRTIAVITEAEARKLLGQLAVTLETRNCENSHIAESGREYLCDATPGHPGVHCAHDDSLPMSQRTITWT